MQNLTAPVCKCGLSSLACFDWLEKLWSATSQNLEYKRAVVRWSWLVVSFWDGLFSGVNSLLVLGRVYFIHVILPVWHYMIKDCNLGCFAPATQMYSQQHSSVLIRNKMIKHIRVRVTPPHNLRKWLVRRRGFELHTTPLQPDDALLILDCCGWVHGKELLPYGNQ